MSLPRAPPWLWEEGAAQLLLQTLSRSRHAWLKAYAPGWRFQPAAASQG